MLCRLSAAGFLAIGVVFLTGGCPGTVQLPDVQEGSFNHNPSASAGADASGAVGETLYLDASLSTDQDGDSLSYQWTKVSGPAASIASANQMRAAFTPATAGLYEFSVAVSDGQGGTGQDTVRISVAGDKGGAEPEEPGTPTDDDGDPILAQATFDTDSEGWAITNNDSATTPIWAPTGGHVGGYIRIEDELTGYKQFFWSAPEAFLGDKSDAYGGTLTFQVTSDEYDSHIDDKKGIWLVKLTGPSTTLVVPVPTPPSKSGWTAYSVKLDTSAGWQHVSTSAGATAQEIRDVLGALAQLQILGDYTGGSGETCGLDDVVLRRP